MNHCMKHHLARVAIAGSLLVLLGAGCAAQERGPVSPTPDKSPQGVPNASVDSDVDSAVDAAVDGASAGQAIIKEENKDEGQLNSTDAELNAYGQAYDSSAL